MRNFETLTFQGNEYEYEIDKMNIIWVKIGDSSIGADQPCPSKPNNEKIKAIAIEILKSHFKY